MTDKPVSKVLVLENSPVHLAAIRRFCDEHNLVGLKVRKNRLMSVLRSNIDLGAILYAEDYGVSPEESLEIAQQIHTVRPELPIILRRTLSVSAPTLDGVNDSLRRVCCAAYTADDMSGLSQVIDEFIFSLVYPNALVRGISEITENILANQFKHLTLRWHTPYIVRDRIIFGEVFSLLGEVTNLIWGAFKNRYIGDAAGMASQIQVPLIVNHQHKYISFGTENPQLCFLYTLSDESTGRTLKLYQRFVFNLNWAPEDFREIVHDTNELVASGELELF